MQLVPWAKWLLVHLVGSFLLTFLFPPREDLCFPLCPLCRLSYKLCSRLMGTWGVLLNDILEAGAAKLADTSRTLKAVRTRTPGQVEWGSKSLSGHASSQVCESLRGPAHRNRCHGSHRFLSVPGSPIPPVPAQHPRSAGLWPEASHFLQWTVTSY